jgi:hypothetical protein
MWWTKGSSLPPLVTTSPGGTPAIDAGVLGQPGTTVLFGDEQGGQEMQIGGRATFGLWLDPEHHVTAAGRFYGLGGDETRFADASDGDPILALPFFNALLGIEDAQLVAFPGVAEGSIQASYEQFNFMGAESFIEIMMERDRCRRTGLIMGYHFLRLDDRLQMDVFIDDDPTATVGTTFDIFDRFATQNEFHGGMIGLRSVRSRGCVSLDSLLKVSFGNMREQVTIAGETLIDGVLVPGGGFFARDTNIGEFEQNRFAFIPELTMNLKYHINPCLNFHIGYNLIWISHAVTAGEQIDRNINPALPIGPQVPVFQFNDENYWVQGLNFGVNFDY